MSEIGPIGSAPRGSGRVRWLQVVGVLIVWSAWRATTGRDVFNLRGWSSFTAFWRAAAHPRLDGEFLRLTAESTATTGAYALLGTVASVVIGVAGGFVVAQRPWEHPSGTTMRRSARRVGRAGVRLAFVVPRAVHEVIWALLAVQVLGFDPWVVIIAIGLQFGAVTAKVYADLVDDADPTVFRSLRAGGAGRLAAVAYGIGPLVRADAVSYAFYRLECAVRSAAVLGIVGLGGLGAQLDLSFESLRYDELWTLIVALMILSGIADRWSSLVRRSDRPGIVGRSWLLLAAAVPVAWWHVGLDAGSLWSSRTRRLAGGLAEDLWPPRLGPGGWHELWQATVDTLAMSTLAALIASLGGLAFAVVAARPHRHDASPVRRWLGWGTRSVLLLMRAVPAPVWAFLVVLVLFPGIWPGAVALGVYNIGVLGRLFAEVIEDHDDHARRQLETAGASTAGQFLYAVLPVTGTRLISLALYRWEVITRETVIVGVVGAAGLGRLIQEHLVARDDAAVLGAIGALAALTIGVDALSSRLRRAFG